MILIKHDEYMFEFDYAIEMNLDGSFNCYINYLDSSEKADELITISDMNIIVDGKAKFPMLFKAENMDHLTSVIGQLILWLNLTFKGELK